MTKTMKLMIDTSHDCKGIALDEQRLAVDPNSLGRSDVTGYIEGIFAQAEKVNRNGRLYPLPVLSKAVSEYKKNYVEKSRALGELNHPEDPDVNPERACILIESLEMRGPDVYGKAKILGTPIGLVLRQLVRDGVQLGVSTRGLGSMTDEKIVEEYMICAIDIVHAPSGIDCFVNGILESAEFYVENNVIHRVDIETVQKSIKKSNIKQLKQDIGLFEKRLFSKLLNK